MRKNSVNDYEAVISDFEYSELLLSEAIGREARAADIYAFGGIMSEIIECHLRLAKGAFFQISSDELESYSLVLRQCLDPKLAHRPTAKHLSLIFHYWFLVLLDLKEKQIHEKNLKNQLGKLLNEPEVSTGARSKL
jgi:hypothetical protein